MSLWRQLTHGIRALTNRAATDQDVADEVSDYLEHARAAHIARGLSPEDALRAARLEIGGVTNVREKVRRYGWENVVDTTFADIRYAVRRLRVAPTFTIVTVLTLALGVGATTAVFSAVNPILFEPLPYPDAGRIMMVVEMNEDGSRNAGTFGMYRGLVERSRSFAALAVLKPWQPTSTGQHQPERFDGQRVSASYFHVLGVVPALGRDFQAVDDKLNGPNVIILSDALWRRLGSDRAIAGRSITLDGNPYVVIGVMPRSFENVLAPTAELWAPLQYDMSLPTAWGHHLRTVGRLPAGISVDQATRELNRIGLAVLIEQHPDSYGRDTRFIATSLQNEVTSGVKSALLAILGAVALVLVIACVNVTNLFFARGVRRRSELALRAALGATRGRLIRQLLTESLLIALLGGLLGMIVAKIGVRALVALSPSELPRVNAIRLDTVVLVFGLIVTTVVGLAVGLLPALKMTHHDPHAELPHESRSVTSGHRRARNSLVVSEVALALVLLVSSGLLLRSLEHLFAVPTGFSAPNVLTMQIQTSGHSFDSDSTAHQFFTEALDAVRLVPGVTDAALTSQLPLSGDNDTYGVHFYSRGEPGKGQSVFRYAVTADYFRTMRIPLERGRLLDERDRADAPLVAVINESLAKRKFGGLDPLGQRLTLGPPQPLYTIVGVVGDVKQMSLTVRQPEDGVYITTSQWQQTDHALSLVVRTRGDVVTFIPAVRNAIWKVDKDQPIVRVATMSGLVAKSAAERRFVLTLFEAFALVALTLAAIGIYGVLSGNVAERTREIGVRLALGARPRSVLALVLGQGMRLTAIGIAIGLAAAAAATQAIASMLFGVSRLDALTYLAVVAVLGTVAVVACAVPAWRAARLDPTIALRVE